MERRDFIKQGTIAAIAASSGSLSPSWAATDSVKNADPIARRRLGKTDVHLSIIGMGGIVVMDSTPSASKNIVAEAVDRGINYFDVAPSYGDAQQLLGPALAPYREKSFLACKTSKRDKAGSRAALEESLQLLKTDHLDLYQFHALTKMTELDQVLGPGGAMETFEAARKEGKVRFIGFSAHSVETAVAAMDRYPVRYGPLPDQLGAGLASELRSHSHPEGAGKRRGHAGHQEHGENRVARFGEERSSRPQVLVPAREFS